MPLRTILSSTLHLQNIKEFLSSLGPITNIQRTFTLRTLSFSLIILQVITSTWTTKGCWFTWFTFFSLVHQFFTESASKLLWCAQIWINCCINDLVMFLKCYGEFIIEPFSVHFFLILYLIISNLKLLNYTLIFLTLRIIFLFTILLLAAMAVVDNWILEWTWWE